MIRFYKSLKIEKERLKLLSFVVKHAYIHDLYSKHTVIKPLLLKII